jgi:hypothetical protein
MVSIARNWKRWGVGLLALLTLAVITACAPAAAQAETTGAAPGRPDEGPVQTAVASAVAATFTAQAAESTSTFAVAQSATATPTPAVTATPSPTAGPPPTATPDVRPDPANWMSWPVLPTISARAVEIYRQGIASGNDPHSFSTIGDCQSEPNVFLGIYDTNRYFFAKGDEYLQAAVDYYKGDFGRQSLSVRDGLSAPSALSPTWAYAGKCDSNENPVQCELRVHKPAVMFINLGTNWRADASTDAYEKYLRQIVELVIANGTVPILSTKADNVEGGNRINQVTARVAHDYDVPLWNFWALAQYLPDHGLDKTRQDVYLTVEAWDARSYSALELLDKLRQEFAKAP